MKVRILRDTEIDGQILRAGTIADVADKTGLELLQRGCVGVSAPREIEDAKRRIYLGQIRHGCAWTVRQDLASPEPRALVGPVTASAELVLRVTRGCGVRGQVFAEGETIKCDIETAADLLNLGYATTDDPRFRSRPRRFWADPDAAQSQAPHVVKVVS